jgi:DNA-binding transcriptional ArsR family regulator
MARTTLDLVDPRIAKALSHPMRARILMILNERVASPNEIAGMIDERLPNVSYHVRALEELDCIELVSTAQRRGAIEHYYRAVVRPFFSDRDWKRLPRSGRQAISDSILQIIWEEVATAMQSGTFESRTDRHLSHTRVALDREGWAEMTKLLAGTLAEAEKIASRSEARVRTSDKQPISTAVTMMLFELPDEDAAAADS